MVRELIAFAIIERVEGKEDTPAPGTEMRPVEEPTPSGMEVMYVIAQTERGTARVLEIGYTQLELLPQMAGCETVEIDELALERLRRAFGLKQTKKSRRDAKRVRF